jgi:hypothetical protein
MKATWDRSDYQDMAQKRLNFTAEQARKIVARHGSAHRGCEFLIHLHQPDIAVPLHWVRHNLLTGHTQVHTDGLGPQCIVKLLEGEGCAVWPFCA